MTNNLQKGLVVVASFVATLFLLLALTGERQTIAPTPPPFHQQPEPPPTPEIPNISNPVPSYQDYDEVIQQLEQWHQEAPDLVSEVGTYGKTTEGKDLYFMRMGNRFIEDKLKVLLFASIHGNESIGTSTMMAFCGTLLSRYGKDDEVTKLLDTREIVLVPVVSPDSYPHSRHVDGVDPNRNFPSQRNLNVHSVPPCAALQSFHKKEKFRAVLCGHSSGRWFLYPWSEIKKETQHHYQYNDLIDRMIASGATGYKKKQSAYFYPGSTIVGGACDWFYRNGCFALTPEFGTHQRKSTDTEIRHELDLVYKAFLIYITEAPKFEIPVTDPQAVIVTNPRISATSFDPIPE